MQRLTALLLVVCVGVLWASTPGESRRVAKRDAGDLDWNVIVDELLTQTRQHIIESGQDEISIPDINEPIEKKFGFIKAKGRFEAWDGRVNSLSSIRRTGPVAFSSVPGKSVTLTAHLGFGSINVRYNYKAKIWRVGPRGQIKASVGSNSVRLRLRMDLLGENSCKYVLEEATVLDMGGFKVHVSGLGPLNWLADRIVTWVARKRRGDIMSKSQQALNSALSRALERARCDPSFARL